MSKEEGLKNKYIIQKTSGETVSPAAEYFVLRLDVYQKDSAHRYACCRAMQTYSKCISTTLPKLAEDIQNKLKGDWNPHADLKKPEYCMWKLNNTSNSDVFMYTDYGDRIPRSSVERARYKFCPYCGRPIV